MDRKKKVNAPKNSHEKTYEKIGKIKDRKLKRDAQLYFPWWSKKTPLKRTKILVHSLSDINLLNINK